MSEVGQGLLLSGVGILITFSALGILILIILALKSLFPPRDAEAQLKPAVRPASGRDVDRKEQLKRKAAAVGVAVLLGRRASPEEGSLGKTLESPPGPWWRKGLDRIHGKE